MPAVIKAVTGPLHMRAFGVCGSRVGVPWWSTYACATSLRLLVAFSTHQLWILIVDVPRGIAAQRFPTVSPVPLVSRDRDGRRGM